MTFVELTNEDGIAWIRLNRPDRLNAFGSELRRDLAAAFKAFDNSPEMHVGIVVGAGSSFCAGRDMKEEAHGGGAVNGSESVNDGLNRHHVLDTTKPLLAAVHGYAIGAGFGLTLGTDYRIATEDAHFAYTEIATGVPGPWDLANYQIVPWAIATEIALLGRRVPASRLLAAGLLNEVVAPGQHEARAREVAKEFLAQPQDLLRATKALMITGRPRPTPEAIAYRVRVGKELRDSPSRTAALGRFEKH
ncbi:MAG: enoyl-CoA hydratase/isomerase family protein [Dehalococcoidia bacterium]